MYVAILAIRKLVMTTISFFFSTNVGNEFPSVQV